MNLRLRGYLPPGRTHQHVSRGRDRFEFQVRIIGRHVLRHSHTDRRRRDRGSSSCRSTPQALFCGNSARVRSFWWTSMVGVASRGISGGSACALDDYGHRCYEIGLVVARCGHHESGSDARLAAFGVPYRHFHWTRNPTTPPRGTSPARRASLPANAFGYFLSGVLAQGAAMWRNPKTIEFHFFFQFFTQFFTVKGETNPLILWIMRRVDASSSTNRCRRMLHQSSLHDEIAYGFANPVTEEELK